MRVDSMTKLTASECVSAPSVLSTFGHTFGGSDLMQRRGDARYRNRLRAFEFSLNQAQTFALTTPAKRVVGETLTSERGSALQINHPGSDVSAPFLAELVDGRKAVCAQMTKLQVLITDDSKTLRDRITERLTPVAGLEIVDTAATVSESLAAIHEHRPDVLVLDLQIGDNNGIEILRSTKIAYPHVKVIVFTNQIEPQYRERCDDLGAEHFLCKSTDLNLLIEIVSKLTAIERPRT